MGLTSLPNVDELRQLYSLDDAKLDAVRLLGTQIHEQLPRLVEEFYAWLIQWPDYRDFFSQPGLLEHVKQQQLVYWKAFFAAEIDEKYLSSRRRVGKVHAVIGLPVQPYIASINHFLQLFLTPLARGGQFTHEQQATITAALDSLARFDTGVALSSVFRHHAECFHEMADGDFSRQYRPRSENDLFGHALARMAARLHEVEQICTAVSAGSLRSELAESGPRDNLARAINSMVRTLRNVNELAVIIASGDYGHEIAPRSEDDQLGRALTAMTQSLRSLTAERERQLWFARARAELGQAMGGNQSAPELAAAILDFLSTLLGAQAATCYLLGSTELTLTASIATSGHPPQTLQLGEGLLGAAAQDRKPRLLLNLPGDYLQLSSSLGSAAPPSILIVPFLRDDRVAAVAEFAAFGKPDADAREFLDIAGPDIALALLSAQTRKHVADLLSETQLQANLLRSSNLELEEHGKALKESQERLRAQQEELESFNEELEEKNLALSQQTRSLEQSHSEILAQARKLELANQYKTEFLANMSHELRTPLNSILILAKLFAENDAGNLSSEQVEAARVIHASGTDLLNIVSDVLDLAKIEAGRVDVVAEPVELASLAHKIEQQFRPVAAEKCLTFVTNCAQQLPATIHSDPVKLAQIIRNLLSNAFKFTQHGSVRLEFRPLDPALDAGAYTHFGSNGIAISVVDTGIGIPHDKQKLIFEPFRQANGSISRGYGGTGLGLSISQEYASILGGTITVRSEENVGSTFTLYLGASATDTHASSPAPRLAAPTSINTHNDQATPNIDTLRPESVPLTNISHDYDAMLRGKTVLLVDDDMRSTFALSKLLRGKGMNVMIADQGQRALDLLNKASAARVDILLTDIMMPGMDGFETMRAIRANKTFAKLPIIALTAKTLPEDRAKCFGAGANDYLAKPVDATRLLSMLRVWLQQYEGRYEQG